MALGKPFQVFFKEDVLEGMFLGAQVRPSLKKCQLGVTSVIKK